MAAIFLTMHKDEALLDAALEVGVKGFVVKDGAASEIVGCIKAVAAGQSFFSPALSGHLLARRNRADSLAGQSTSINGLTVSERRVLLLIGESKTNQQIAGELFISVRTVEHHRADALAAYERHRPDWVFMDIEMSRTDGLKATRDIVRAFPDAKVLIVSKHDDEQLRTAAHTAGACGYVLKENLIAVRELLEQL